MVLIDDFCVNRIIDQSWLFTLWQQMTQCNTMKRDNDRFLNNKGKKSFQSICLRYRHLNWWIVIFHPLLRWNISEIWMTTFTFDDPKRWLHSMVFVTVSVVNLATLTDLKVNLLRYLLTCTEWREAAAANLIWSLVIDGSDPSATGWNEQYCQLNPHISIKQITVDKFH